MDVGNPGSDVLIVDSTDSSILFAGGGTLHRHDSSGWTDVTYQHSASGIHVDQHAAGWAGNRLIIGNDGGVWATTDRGATWASLNVGTSPLSTIQFRHGSVHPTNPIVALGGSQDNAVEKRPSSGGLTWNRFSGGDGFSAFFSPLTPDTSTGDTFDTGVQRYVNGVPYDVIQRQVTGLPFLPSVENCSLQDGTVILGTHKLWRTTQFFTGTPPAWSLRCTDLGEEIHAMGFAPSDPSCGTYAFGANNGALSLTTNDGSTCAPINAGLPPRPITDVAFDSCDANTIYVTLEGYDENTPGQPGHVFKTTNAGALWSNISPPVNTPHHTVLVDPVVRNVLYVGTHFAVWKSPDSGSTWTQLGPSVGMPNVEVDDLQGNAKTNEVVAFTFGRGAFALPLNYCVGDCNGDGQVTVDEILTAINISMGSLPICYCVADDANRNGQISSAEIQQAVNNDLNGCPAGGAAPLSAGPLAGPVPGKMVTQAIGSASGAPGTSVTIPVTMRNGGGVVAAAQLDLLYPAGVLTNPSCVKAPRLSAHSLFTALPSSPPAAAGTTRLRTLLVDLDGGSTFADGPLLRCSFTIDPTAAPGVYPILGERQNVSDQLGDELVSTVTNGSVTVH